MYGLSLSRPPIPKKNHTHTTLSPLGVIRGIGRISIGNCVCAVCVQCVCQVDGWYVYVRAYVMGRHWYVTTTISCPVVGWLQVSCQTIIIRITPLLFSNGVCVCVHIHTIGVSLIYIYLSMDRSIYIHQNRIYIYVCVYIYSVLVTQCSVVVVLPQWETTTPATDHDGRCTDVKLHSSLLHHFSTGTILRNIERLGHQVVVTFTHL